MVYSQDLARLFGLSCRGETENSQEIKVILGKIREKSQKIGLVGLYDLATMFGTVCLTLLVVLYM